MRFFIMDLSILLILVLIGFAQLVIGVALFYIGLEIIVGIPLRIILFITETITGEVNHHKKKKLERYDTQDDLSRVEVKRKNNYVKVESLRLHDDEGRDTLHKLMDKSSYPFDDTFLPDEDSIRRSMRVY